MFYQRYRGVDMTVRSLIGFSLVLISLSLGCAKAKIVNSPGTIYDSMGYLEEKIPVRGLLLKRSYPALTKKLDKKLAAKAHSKYGADAVNNIQYWPSPDADAFVDYLYARGEMIRYKPFEQNAKVSSTDRVG